MPIRLLLAGTGLAIMLGCSSKLETGYRPAKLNSSEAERRAYYADAFSPEANALGEPNRAMQTPRSPRRF